MSPLLLVMLGLARAGEPLFFDVGPFRAPVAEGWSRLDQEGSGDGRATWTLAPNRAANDDYPDPLTGDSLSGGQLHLALGAGTWRVWALMGRDVLNAADLTSPWGLRSAGVDLAMVAPPRTWAELRDNPAWALGSWSRFLPGETVWDRLLRPAEGWVGAAVEVGNEGLLVEPIGRPLQALVVAPASDVGQVGPRLAEDAAARRSWFHRHHAPEATAEPLPSLPDQPGVALAGWDEIPIAGALTETPRRTLSVAPGERAGLVLWLPGDQPAQAIVRAPADVQVETWEVGWIDTALASRPRRVRPDLLRPTNGALRGGQGLPTGLGLTLSVPADARPGRRAVVVDLRRGQKLVRAVLTVDVRPIHLPPPPIDAGFISQVPAVATALHGFGSAEVLALIDEDLSTMRSLGATLLSMRQLTLGSGWPEAPIDRSGRLATGVWQRWAALGGRQIVWPDPKVGVRPAAYLHPDEDPLPDALAAPLQALLGLTRSSPIPVVVPFWEEEGGWRSAAAPERARLLVPQLRALTSAPLAATAAHPLDWQVAGTFDVILLSTQPPLTRATVDRIRAAGSRPWAYNQAPGRTGPLVAWAVGAEALLQWFWSPQPAQPFHDAHRAPVAWYAAQGPGGLWRTALAERWAEGLVDVCYLAALEQAAQQLASDPSPAWRAEAAAAQATVDAVRASLDGALPAEAWGGDVLAPAAVDALRQEVRGQLERLQGRVRARG